MRILAAALIFLISPFSTATPLKYSFQGYTSSIVTDNGDYDPSSPLIRDDGFVVTNGDSLMSGYLIFDPSAVRDGPSGTGVGQVLEWSFSTQGLNYHSEGSAFHFLTFSDTSFRYLDEFPEGGYGPDVAYMGFDFRDDPFSDGPIDFPVSDFIGGDFHTTIDLARVNDDLMMWGLEGKITDLQVEEWTVPNPSSLLIMTIGLLGMFIRDMLRKKAFFCVNKS